MSSSNKTRGNAIGTGAAIVAILGIGMGIRVVRAVAKRSASHIHHIAKPADEVGEYVPRLFDDVSPNATAVNQKTKSPNPNAKGIAETVVDMAKGEHDEPVIYPEESDQHESATAGVLPKSTQAGSKQYDWLPEIIIEDWTTPINQPQQRRR